MNKIALAQINTIAGNINYNAEKIVEYIKKAKQDDVNIIIFPELALMGFPLGDIIVRHQSIIKRQLEALEKIKNETKNITAVVGFVESQNNENFNSVAIISNGEITQTIKEDASTIIEINGEKFGFLIGKIEETPIFDSIPDTIINCACEESRTGKEFQKHTLLSNLAKTNNVNVIYVNKAGYADNQSFDGTSRIYNKKGELTLRAKSFEEDYIISENYSGKINQFPFGMDKEIEFSNFNLDYSNDLDRTYKSIVYSIKEYFAKNGFTKAVLGLSGGLDSTICSVLLVDALGKENVYGISMPSKITSSESKNDAKLLADNLGMNFFEIPIAQSVDSTKNMLNSAFDSILADKYEKSTTIENLQARTRATLLWSIANEHKGMLPIATSDKSEAYIGYATVNGDMSGGFAPILDVTKTKLFALGHFLNKTREQKNTIPQSILEKPPGAELKINPKTGKTVCAEEENMPYPFLDEIIWQVENFGFGFDDLMNHKFYYEKDNKITNEQKEEWIKKFFWKQHCAVFKWHIIPPSVITDAHSINSAEYRQPIISKIY